MRRSLRRRHSYPPQTDVAGHESSNTGSSRFSEIAEVETADFRVHEKLEPFVSPLTEANLKYHTSSHPCSKDTRYYYVQCFVDSQAAMLRMEMEMRRRREAEIQSLVPLDIQSVHEQVIPEEPSQKKRKKRRKNWRSFFKRWLGGAHKEPEDTATVRRARHRSWAPNDDSYYRKKMDMIQQGINANIARALGADASMIFSPASHHHHNNKRDSGVSVVSRSIRFPPRFFGIVKEEEEEEEQEEEEEDEFIAFRYPKMVSRQALREAAIRILSSSELLEPSTSAKRFSDPGINGARFLSSL